MFSIQCYLDMTSYDHSAAHFFLETVYILFVTSKDYYFIGFSSLLFGSEDRLCHLIVTFSALSSI